MTEEHAAGSKVSWDALTEKSRVSLAEGIPAAALPEVAARELIAP
jgi:hypothetical protein